MLFLILGIVIGISTVVTLLSITESMTKNIEEKLNQFGANIVIVPKPENLPLNYGGIDVGGVNYKVAEFDQERLEQIKTIKNSKNLSIIAPKVLGSVKVDDKTILLMGVIFEQELALKTWWEKQSGVYPNKNDQVMLGSQAAKILGYKSEDNINIADQSFNVASVLMPTGASEDNAIIASLIASQKILNKEGKISMIEISAFCQGCPITELTLQIAEKFPDGKVTAMRQAVMSKMQSIEMFRTFSMGVSIIVILIGSLLVFVTMMGFVNERTREIGIFRAIGFRKGHVMQVILLEAFLLGIFGGILGFASGNLIAYIVVPLTLKDSLFAGINIDLGIVSVLMAIALSLIASFYPAFKASNMDPGQALRSL